MNTTHRLWIDVIKMVLNKLHRRRQISGVEFIRDIPTQRPKLASLLHNGVQESCCVQHWFPLRHVGHIKLILRINTINLKIAHKFPAFFFHENTGALIRPNKGWQPGKFTMQKKVQFDSPELIETEQNQRNDKLIFAKPE